MEVSPSEAEEALAAIKIMEQKTRRSIADSGAYITLIATGVVWLFGYISTQFLPPEILPYIWIGLSILGSALGTIMGVRIGRRVRNPSTTAMAKRIGLFWLLLVLYGIAAIAVAQ